MSAEASGELCFSWQEPELYLLCKLQPKAAKDEFSEVAEGRIKIRITAAPVDGKANKHLVKFLAKQFKVPQNAVSIISGDASRLKRVQISNPQVVPIALALLAPTISKTIGKQ